jgi:lysophospholipase L1-like esterase
MLCSFGAHAQVADSHWVRTWGAPMQAPEDFDDYPGVGQAFRDVTLRQVAVATLAGRRLRVWFSNEFGTRPLVIGAAHVAHALTGSAILPDTDRKLSFGGRAGIVVQPGAAVVSDIVDLDTAAGTALSISLYLPRSTEGSPNTVHEEPWRGGYLSPSGNYVGGASLPVAADLHSYFFLSGIDVEAPSSATAIVALGDSITDGTGSTTGAGRSWPEQLAKLLAKTNAGRYAVLNMGIGGNRLLNARTGPAALVRADRDVFAVPGVRILFILEGINDIGGAEWFSRPEEEVSAEDLEVAFRQLVDRAHEHGIWVIGATVTPSGGCTDPGYDSPASEAKRQAVNAWIRNSRTFDAVVDFDRVVLDPAKPSRMRPEFDSGDHLHPNDAGYAAMAGSIDPALLARR